MAQLELSYGDLESLVDLSHFGINSYNGWAPVLIFFCSNRCSGKSLIVTGGSKRKSIVKGGPKEVFTNVDYNLFRSEYRRIQPLLRFPCHFIFMFTSMAYVLRAEDDSWLSRGVTVVKAVLDPLASF